MRSIGLVSCASIISVFLGLACATAQTPDEGQPSIQGVADRIVKPVIEELQVPAVTVGISRAGKRYFFPYGSLNGRDPLIERDTLIEIGSVTEVFTTTLLTIAANDWKLSLDDPIQRYMPDQIRLKPKARRVTLRHLADFRSGMPNLPSNVSRKLTLSAQHYTNRDFLNFVKNWEPAAVPAPYAHSDAAIGLLGYLVANAMGRNWTDLLKEEITGPLRMKDTLPRLHEEQRRRLAKGYRADGTPAPEWPIFAWYAAGCLRSTVQDMLSFGEANLGHPTVDGTDMSRKLTSALQFAQQPQHRPRDSLFEQALGWTVLSAGPEHESQPIVIKEGETAGFSCSLLVNRSKDLAVFIVASKSQVPCQRLGVEIVRHIP